MSIKNKLLTFGLAISSLCSCNRIADSLANMPLDPESKEYADSSASANLTKKYKPKLENFGRMLDSAEHTEGGNLARTETLQQIQTEFEKENRGMTLFQASIFDGKGKPVHALVVDDGNVRSAPVAYKASN